MDAQAICDLAERTYLRCAPSFGVHVECRAFASIVAGICVALDIPYTYVWDAEQHHHFVRLADGTVIERYWGNARAVCGQR